MSDFLKNTLMVNQLVTSGTEGFRAKGQYDPDANDSYPYFSTTNGGRCWFAPFWLCEHMLMWHSIRKLISLYYCFENLKDEP